MAEQVEKGSQEAVEPAGPDVAEDLDAAAEGFVSRVVTGLERFSFGFDTVGTLLKPTLRIRRRHRLKR